MPLKSSIKTHAGRVALVTGAGQAIALALAERGAQVIATDLTPPDETVRKIGSAACALQLDVTQEEQWRSAAAQARDTGDVDIVVNNAGYFPNRSIDELDLVTWRKPFATNLDSHFLSVKHFLPAMRQKKWGRFVGIYGQSLPVFPLRCKGGPWPTDTLLSHRERSSARRMPEASPFA